MTKFLLLFFVMMNAEFFSQKKIKLYDYDEKDSVVYSLRDNLIYKCIPDKYSIDNSCENTQTLLDSVSTKHKVLKQLFKNNASAGYLLIPRKIQPLDLNYQYSLPFRKGKYYRVSQGYNGRISHQNSHALDFDMMEGTEVLAAREGLVIGVQQGNNIGCADQLCAKFANYLYIFHPDGSVAEYYHFKQFGINVKLGDTVKKGDLLGFSGSTGWSNGPHLHFICYSDFFRKKSIKTLFRINDGNKIEYLKEGKNYAKNY